MFIVRTAFWAALVILLLPTDAQQQAHLSAFAQEKLDWAMTTCERQPAACERAGELWSLFLEKAEFGVRLAGELIREGMASRSGGLAHEASAG